MDRELCYLSISDLGRAYREHRCSPVEVTEAHLRRIDALEPALGCYITVTAVRATAAAEEAARRYMRGTPLGPLDGIPLGLKDLFDTAGVLTTAGSRQFMDRVPADDSDVVRSLVRGGAVLIGKHSMFEFASGMPAPDVPFPTARNPWDTAVVPGGSSSGSAAAVAGGLCAGAFGSDSGGSIRGPASYCGVVGFKPSAGILSRTGVIPLSWTLDEVGPIARTVEDAAVLLHTAAGHSSNQRREHAPPTPESVVSPASAVIRGLRIGFPRSLVRSSPDLDGETMAACERALADLESRGAHVEEIEIPGAEHANAVVQTLITSEALAYHERRAREAPERFGSVFYGRLLQGALLSAADYIAAQRGRVWLARAMREVMAAVDLLVMPTTPHPARPFGAASDVSIWDATNFTRIFNVSRQPAITIPCGFTERGLPIGLQLAGRLFDDATVLSVAAAYEREHEWSSRHPAA
jgi:aspartyl-tRNA(Asn)/glutamyl-tRNA(Gln) amidotransferase subunit A